MTDPEGGRGRPEVPAPVQFVAAATAAFRLLQANFGSLLFMFLIAGAGIFAVQVGAGLLVVSDEITSTAVAVAVLLFVLPAFVNSILVGLSALLVADRLAGIETSPGRTWREARSRLRDMAASALISTMLALLILVVPPLALLLALMLPLFFGPPVIMHSLVLENLHFGAAWKRARALWAGHLMRSGLYVFTIGLATILLSVILGQLVTDALDQFVALNRTGVNLLAAAFSTLFGSLLFAYLAVFMLVIYFDLRARKEDFGPAELRTERQARD